MRRFGSAVVTCSVLLLAGFVGSSAAAAQGEESSWIDTIAGWLDWSDGTDKPQEAVYRDATPSEVFRAVQDLTAEITVLRDEFGVYDFPPEAEAQEDRAPVHVYAKTLEVLSKVIGVQQRFGVPAGAARQIPFKEIESGDVLANVQHIIDEVREFKVHMVIEREIEPATLVEGQTASSVYKSLADASFLLDGLRGRPLTPDDVYQNCTYILDEMERVAEALGVSFEAELPEVEDAKRPKDVAQQVLRATYKMINLQTRLGMDASGVPGLTLVRVTPSEVFDSTNMLLAEMARIKLHLDIDAPREERPAPRGKTPSDVFAQVLGIIRNLDRMSAAVAS